MSSTFNDKQLEFLKRLLKELENEDFNNSFNTRQYYNEYNEFKVPKFFNNIGYLVSPEERKERFREIIKCNLEQVYLITIGDRISKNRAKRSNQQFSIDSVYNPLEECADPSVIKAGATIFAIISVLATNLYLLSSKTAEVSAVSASIVSAMGGAGIGVLGTITLAGVGASGAKLVGLIKEVSYKIGNHLTHFEDQCIALEKSSQLMEEMFDRDKVTEKATDELEDCFQNGTEKMKNQEKRNDICRCSSGLRLKNCCGLSPDAITEEKIVEDLNKIIKSYREQYLNFFITHINSLIDENRLKGSKSK